MKTGDEYGNDRKSAKGERDCVNEMPGEEKVVEKWRWVQKEVPQMCKR